MAAKSMNVVTSQSPGHEDEIAAVGERFVRLAEQAWVSFASMVAHRQHAWPQKLLSGKISFTSSARGIQLHLAMAGNFPRIPGITPGIGLVHYPLSFATHQFALLVQLGGLAPRSCDRATNNMSQFRWFHKRPRRVLLVRPAGLSITVDDPKRRSHHPRARRLLRVNSATELQLTAPCSLLSLIRSSFRPRARRVVRRSTDLVAGFPPCGRPRARHSGDRRFGSVVASDSGSIGFVSYLLCK